MLNQKHIKNYEGLYGDEHEKYSSEYILLELIATRSQYFDWHIQPHIHLHLFQVFIVEKGQIIFQENIQNQQIQAPCIFFIPPTFLHGLTYTPDVEGYILTVSASIIEDIFQTSTDIFQTFEKIQIIQHFEDEWAFDNIRKLVKTIEAELFSDHSERSVMLRAYLAQFLIQLHRLSQHGEEINSNSISIAYFRKFQKSIKNSAYPKSIPTFAAELNITPVHLNRICKAVSGKSSIDLVNQNLINEAQKYLLHTSYSISEIAYLLKFEYPNYFAKLFKKYVGISPMEFRSKNRN
jgi:AraC family transcriptional regulator, transcriptional activator of pobA